MQLFQTVGLDRNTLPYFVKNAAGVLLPVRFVPLTPSDIPELTGPRWADAVFTQTWAGFAGDSQTFKLIKVTETGQNKEGMIRLGSVPLEAGDYATACLRFAPANRFSDTAPRRLTGVGRALVSRLVVEEYNSGGNSALFVRLIPTPLAFINLSAYAKSNRQRLAFTCGAGRNFVCRCYLVTRRVWINA